MEEKSRDVRQKGEYSAKSVKDALDLAARDWGVSPGELEYKILRDTTHTILGFVRTGEITLSVWLSATSVPEPVASIVEPETVVIPEATASVEPVVEEGEELGDDEDEPEDDVVDFEAVACDTVATLLDKMGVLAAVEVVDRGGETDPVTGEVSPLLLNIVGDDLGMLIGRRGETLRDLQYIARLIVSRQIGHWPDLVLDVEGYKARRASSLQALAQRMAEQVRRTGHPVTLEPMPAYERRIVHLALRDDPDVYTESTGEDEGRKVQVLPR